MAPPYDSIYATVAAIPSGRVANYGQIADAAGIPGRSRLVGRALRECPDDLDLPWHRVLRSDGRIAFPVDSEEWKEQRARLRDEGVQVKNGRVDFKIFRWQPLDELLWGDID